MSLRVTKFQFLCIPKSEHHFIESKAGLINCIEKTIIFCFEGRIENENCVRYGFANGEFWAVQMEKRVLFKVDLLLFKFKDILKILKEDLLV